MTLIPDCIREILLTIEEKGTNNKVLENADFDYIDYDMDIVFHHMQLLVDEDFILAKVYIDSLGDYIIEVKRMTMAGHKYLDNIRDGIVWEETKRTISEQFKSVSMSVIGAVAGAIINKKLGL